MESGAGSGWLASPESTVLDRCAPCIGMNVNYRMLGCWRALQVENFPALGSPGKTQLSSPIYCPVFLKQQGPLP